MWFSQYSGALLTDSKEYNKLVYDDDYRTSGRDLLIDFVKDEMLQDSTAFGTLNGSSGHYDRINSKSSGIIQLRTTRTIAPETDTEDLSFENVAEIIQFSNEAGRKAEREVSGDAAIWSCQFPPPGDTTEVGSGYDTGATEKVLLSPPTGKKIEKIESVDNLKEAENFANGNSQFFKVFQSLLRKSYER